MIQLLLMAATFTTSRHGSLANWIITWGAQWVGRPSGQFSPPVACQRIIFLFKKKKKFQVVNQVTGQCGNGISAKSPPFAWETWSASNNSLRVGVRCRVVRQTLLVTMNPTLETSSYHQLVTQHPSSRVVLIKLNQAAMIRVHLLSSHQRPVG